MLRKKLLFFNYHEQVKPKHVTQMNEEIYSGSPSLVTDLTSPSSEANEKPFTKSLKQFTRGTKAAK